MSWIVLDRDGVINQDSDRFIKSPDEWIPIAGSLEAIALLNQQGWQVIVATNQSGIGRGLYDEATLAAIHRKMTTELAKVGGTITGIFFCPHTNADACDCRKPKPGLLHQAAAEFNISWQQVPFVGDSLRDLQAGASVGCQPFLVLTGKGKKTLEQGELPENTQIFSDLSAIAMYLIKE